MWYGPRLEIIIRKGIAVADSSNNGNKYGHDAIAAALESHWSAYPLWLNNKSKNLETLLQKQNPNSGIKSLDDFIANYSTEQCKLSVAELHDLILLFQYLFNWLKDNFDSYSRIDEIKGRLKRIEKLSYELSKLTSETEIFFLTDSKYINFKQIESQRDGVGNLHTRRETFYGDLMTRVCIDSGLISLALSDLDSRARRSSGKSPKIAHNWLIGQALKLFEEMRGEPAKYSTPKNPKKFSDYANNIFLHFVIDLAGMFEPENHNSRISNTGYPSKIARVKTNHGKHPQYWKGLIPSNDISELIYSINGLANIK